MHRILIACLPDETINQLSTILHGRFAELKLSITQAANESESHMEYTDYDLAFVPADLRFLARLRGISLEVPFIVIAADHHPNLTEFIEQGAQDVLAEHELVPQRVVRAAEFAIARQDGLNEMHGFVRLEREIGRRTDMKPMLDIVTDLIVRRTGAKSCVIAYVMPNTQMLQVLAKLGQPGFVPDAMPRSEITHHPELARIFNPKSERIQIDIHSQRLVMALELHGERLGFVSLERLKPTMPSPELLRFYKYLSSRIGLAIAKLLTYELAEYQARQMQRLYEVSMSLTTTMDQDEIMEIAAWGLASLLEADAVLAALYDDFQQTMSVRGLHGRHQVLDYTPALGATLDMTRLPQLHRALLEHRTLRRLSLDTVHDLALITELETISPYAMVALPLPLDGGLLGMVVICAEGNRIFTNNDLALAQSVALQLVNVMQHAALYAEVRELETIKTEMIQRASHDLKNPIHVITGYFELLTETLPPPPEREELQVAAIESINAALITMMSLVEDILTLERIENQRNVQFNPVDLGALTYEITTHLRRQADLKQQHLQLDMLTAHGVVHGEETQLRQVLQNLINNAIKYTPDGGKIIVRTNVFEGDFYFEVEDNGYGIPQDRQERLFERFYRAQTPGTESIKGSGLGLYLVKQVVERHRGNLWFKSTEGKGSTFGFRIPTTA